MGFGFRILPQHFLNSRSETPEIRERGTTLAENGFDNRIPFSFYFDIMAGFSASTVSAAVYLNPLVWVLWLLDFALWLLLPPWNLILFLLQLFRGGYSYMLKGSDNVRHKKGIKELLETPIDGCSTVHELMQESFSKHGPYKAMGTRTFKGWHTPKGGKFPLKKFGDTKWQSYAEASNRSSAFGRGLRALGMEPLPIKSSRACTEEFLVSRNFPSPFCTYFS